MDSSRDGTVVGHSLERRSKMSVDEKRQLVHELSKNSDLAIEALQAWTRQEILQILSLELGKQRKYTGFTKAKIIKILLKTLSKKNPGDQEQEMKDSSPIKGNSSRVKENVVAEDQQAEEDQRDSYSKRRRKNLNPSRYVTPKSFNLDDYALPSKKQGSTNVRFEDVQATSLTLIITSEESSSQGNIIHHSIWHRKVTEKECTSDSTGALFSPNTRFVVSGLTPATEYCFKVVSFRGIQVLCVNETKVSTKPLQEKEEDEQSVADSLTSLTNCNNLSPPPQLSVETESNSEDKRETGEDVVSLKTDTDVIEIKKNTFEEEKKLTENVSNREDSAGCGLRLEHCVKIIRHLECSGYLEKNFRQKFLTWYTLRATEKEKIVVKTFIHTFKDDLMSLAEQLVDTFSDYISRKCSTVGGGNGSSGSGAAPGSCKKPHH